MRGKTKSQDDSTICDRCSSIRVRWVVIWPSKTEDDDKYLCERCYDLHVSDTLDQAAADA